MLSAETVQYFVTVTLRPSVYSLIPQDQLIKANQEIRQIFDKLRVTERIVSFELTQNCNIHYHGIIRFKLQSGCTDYRMKWFNALRGNKVIGFTKIEQVENYQSCFDYITKSIHQTSNSLSQYPLIFDTRSESDSFRWSFLAQRGHGPESTSLAPGSGVGDPLVPGVGALGPKVPELHASHVQRT